MKFTVTFIALVIIGIIGLFIITSKKDNNSTDINQILSEATQSANMNTGQEEQGNFQLPNQNPQQQQQQQIPPKPTTGELKTAQQATITTSKGEIVMTLYPEVAPKTVSNFVTKAQSGFYNNLTFHRVEDWVIQGGDPDGNGTGGGNMATELNSKPFVKGSLGVARGGDIKVSNDSQFFITKTPADWLDNQYTNFGIVTEGMDVVEKIAIGDKIISVSVE